MKLLKLGGSVITNKKGRCEANLQNIEKLAKMLGELWALGERDIVLVHGAGSFGHALVIEKNLQGKLGKERLADVREVQRECANLSEIVVSNLRKNGIAAQRVAAHEIIDSKNGRIFNIDKSAIHELLENEKMPVLYGDMVDDFGLGFSVCSGDQIIANLSEDADFTVLGTDVDGILIEGKVVEKIDSTEFEKIKNHLGRSGSPDVTGGMLGKINEMKEVGGRYFVVNANYPQRIADILRGKKVLYTKLDF